MRRRAVFARARWALAAVSTAVSISVFSVATLSGCSEAPDYARGSADEALDSARRMVEAGDAEYLATLVYAEDESMRSLLNQAGLMLGALQDLAAAVSQRFPNELEALRRDAELASQENRATTWARWLAPGSPIAGSFPGLGRPQASSPADAVQRQGLGLGGLSPSAPTRATLPALPEITDSQRDILLSLSKQLLADPYAWLERGRSKLGTLYIADDIRALTWDDKPILAPIGLVMREGPEGWQVVIPWHLPGLSTIKPRSESEHLVFGSILKTMENLARDLERDIRAGTIRDLDDMADTALEKAALPVALVAIAYTNLIEERGGPGAADRRAAERRAATADAVADAAAAAEAPPIAATTDAPLSPANPTTLPAANPAATPPATDAPASAEPPRPRGINLRAPRPSLPKP